MNFHIQQWIERLNEPQFNWACAGFWGWQREVEKGETWDIHKSGYDFNSLSKLLTEIGFINIKWLSTDKSQDLHITCQK